ncbi:hypothetical protein WH47_00803 [Habropoda laboriosa]|uniref:Uncharacterized protein n=1 Tax=Habropoda laboriosa TaxID=597456 RepID=A0A0L7QK38_9HYME|nr:hypothetical protein WH47_00803 [Habropoda laboriosa]
MEAPSGAMTASLGMTKRPKGPKGQDGRDKPKGQAGRDKPGGTSREGQDNCTVGITVFEALALVMCKLLGNICHKHPNKTDEAKPLHNGDYYLQSIGFGYVQATREYLPQIQPSKPFHSTQTPSPPLIQQQTHLPSSNKHPNKHPNKTDEAKPLHTGDYYLQSIGFGYVQATREYLPQIQPSKPFHSTQTPSPPLIQQQTHLPSSNKHPNKTKRLHSVTNPISSANPTTNPHTVFKALALVMGKLLGNSWAGAGRQNGKHSSTQPLSLVTSPITSANPTTYPPTVFKALALVMGKLLGNSWAGAGRQNGKHSSTQPLSLVTNPITSANPTTYPPTVFKALALVMGKLLGNSWAGAGRQNGKHSSTQPLSLVTNPITSANPTAKPPCCCCTHLKIYHHRVLVCLLVLAWLPGLAPS